MTERSAPWRLKLSVCALLAVLAPLACVGGTRAEAAEIAGLSGLQSGPLGSGPGFRLLSRFDTEVFAAWEQASGRELRDGRRDESRAVTSLLAAGFGLGVDKTFSFVGSISGAVYEYKAPRFPSRAGTSVAGSLLSIGGGPALWLGDVFLAGQASVLSYGRESSTFTDEFGEKDTVADPVAFPVLTLYGGWRKAALVVVGNAKLYNDGTTSRRLEGAEPSAEKRRSPPRIGLDARWSASEKLRIAAAAAIVGAAQAETVGDRAPSSQVSDYGTAAIGGLYEAAPWIAVAGSYRYTEAAFANSESAATACGNLGGSRVELGFQYRELALSAQLGASYTVAPAVDFVTAGGKAHTEETIWSATGGATLHW